LAFFVYLIIDEVGYIGWSVVVIFGVSLAIQSWIDRVFENTNLKRMAISDKRGRKINEIISGVKVIKFTAWERVMNRLTKSFRMEEGSQILKAFTLYNLSHSISTMIPTILALVVFSLYNKINEEQLGVSTIYELINLFNASLTPIRYYIMGATARSDSQAASKRIATLIQLEE